jgi:hypothetical protein
MTRKSGPRPKARAESDGRTNGGNGNGGSPPRGPWLAAPEQLALHREFKVLGLRGPNAAQRIAKQAIQAS